MFKFAFESKLTELGIVFARCPNEYPLKFKKHRCAAGPRVCGSNALDYDAHIIVFSNLDYPHDLDWSRFTYGSKLFKAKHLDNPELKKLKALFEWLVIAYSYESPDESSDDDDASS
jgi:hypothetical protein